jgi:aspartate/methionine/tyrosine aminotransferase
MRTPGPGLTRGGGRRLAAIQAPIVPIVADLIHAHPGTLSLSQGVVGYGPPIAALAGLAAGAGGAEHWYGPVAGEPELLDAFAHKLARDNGIDARAHGYCALVTAGSNMGFLNALLAITDPGDEILLPLPYYFNHEMAVRMVDCVPVAVPTRPDFQLDPERIRSVIGPRTRAVVTVSPNNPTGAVYSPDSLRAVNRQCRSAGIYHLSDEAYEYFSFGSTKVWSPAADAGASEHTIALYSMSKTYGMAGWRVGFTLAPGHLLPALLKVQDTNVICATRIAQRVALGALGSGPEHCRRHLPAIAETRLHLQRALRALAPRVRLIEADGAFYFLVRVDTDMADLELVRRLVLEYGIAVIPGSAFGMTDATYLRISYGALDAANRVEAVRRLCAGLAGLLR